MHSPSADTSLRIISGGQTGVDRAALDVAIELGLPHGGWCPMGRLAEDGFIPVRYRLRQTISPQYAFRTERNVVDSDGTLILYRRELTGGTELTARFCRIHHKPSWMIDVDRERDDSAFHTWFNEQRIRVLNVAGPRESTAPGIGDTARELLRQLLGNVRGMQPAEDVSNSP